MVTFINHLLLWVLTALGSRQCPGVQPRLSADMLTVPGARFFIWVATKTCACLAVSERGLRPLLE